MPEMRSKKVLIPLAIILSLVTVVFLAYSWINSLSSSGWGSCIPELSIGTSYNGTTKTLDLNITSMVDRTITFQQLAIKDSKSSLMFKSTLPSVELHPKENISISTNIGETQLNQGNGYSIELLSNSGQKYSSNLILFEWIQVTNVSYSSPRTLLVEVNSPSNQTIFFDQATIYQWKEKEGGPMYVPVTDGTQSPSRILPNQNITVTINLQKEINSGTYDLWLSYSPPPYVRGGERVNFVVA
jgi:hypothetical protein